MKAFSPARLALAVLVGGGVALALHLGRVPHVSALFAGGLVALGLAAESVLSGRRAAALAKRAAFAENQLVEVWKGQQSLWDARKRDVDNSPDFSAVWAAQEKLWTTVGSQNDRLTSLEPAWASIASLNERLSAIESVWETVNGLNGRLTTVEPVWDTANGLNTRLSAIETVWDTINALNVRLASLEKSAPDIWRGLQSNDARLNNIERYGSAPVGGSALSDTHLSAHVAQIGSLLTARMDQGGAAIADQLGLSEQALAGRIDQSRHTLETRFELAIDMMTAMQVSLDDLRLRLSAIGRTPRKTPDSARAKAATAPASAETGEIST